MPRRKKQKTETRSVPDLVEDFMDEDWEVLESVEVCENSDLTTFKRKRKGTKLDRMKQFISPDIWAILHRVVQRNIVKRVKVRTIPSKKDIIKMYGIQMLLEESYGNDTHNLRDHFKKEKKKWNSDNFPMGADRFIQIRASLVPTVDEIKEICKIMSANFREVLEMVHVLVFDELVGGYEPSKIVKERADDMGEPIPVVNIPSKPNPNGFLDHLMATFVASVNFPSGRMPYIVDIIPASFTAVQSS
mmetsp:Transcript_7070/g.10818  ORF Transcript_7070/g.10818 Transcript_7070/m.10818 type:complete len:246 (-) Transcript_7070:883-1620(-)